MKHLPLTLTALLLAPLAALHAAAPPVVCWTFDEARETAGVQQLNAGLDSPLGAIEIVSGVRGNALKFDGYTSRLVRPAKELPPFGSHRRNTPGLGRELWITTRTHGRDSFSGSIISAKSDSTQPWTVGGWAAIRRSPCRC